MTPGMSNPEQLANRLESLMLHSPAGFLTVDDRSRMVQMDFPDLGLFDN